MKPSKRTRLPASSFTFAVKESPSGPPVYSSSNLSSGSPLSFAAQGRSGRTRLMTLSSRKKKRSDIWQNTESPL